MTEPWAMWGAAVLVGAWSWPWLQPAPVALAVALGACLVLYICGAGTRTARLLLSVSGLLMGLLAPATLPEPPEIDSPQRVVGVVVGRSGTQVDVDADVGRLRIRVHGGPPPVGASLAAWVRSAAVPDRLPGQADRRIAARRARRTLSVARQWVRLGGRERSADDPFLHARHPGLLRALTGDGATAAPSGAVLLLTRTGTRHLLAVSGLHIGLVAAAAAGMSRLMAAPLAWLPWVWPCRFVPPLAGLLAAVSFGAHAGWPTSSRRALLMYGVGSLAWVLGRRPRPTAVLGMVAGGMTLADPGLPGDLGFRLSFGAVAGILLVGPRLSRLLPPDLPWLIRKGATGLAVTVGATAGTLPDAAYTFQALSPVAPVANLLVMPPLAGIVVPAALAGKIIPGAMGGAAVAMADAGCGLALDVLLLLDRPPWTPAVGMLGAAGIGLGVVMRRRPALAGLMLMLSLALRPTPAGRLAVTFLSVGQGDGALLEHPDGRRWLVDGGPPGADVLGWLRRSGIRRLDAVVLSHPHPDHMAGLVKVVQEMPVARVFVSRPPEAGETQYLAFWHAAFASGARVGPPAPGEGGVRWLHPGEEFAGIGRPRLNDESLVMEVQHGDHRVLFAGDVERRAETWLAPRLHRVTVVKAPHHGSRTSSTRRFVAAVDPEWVVLSVGSGNRHRHPHAAALGRWQGARMVRTDRDGSIRFRTDGETLAVERWREFRGWSPLVRAPWRPRSPRRREAASFVGDAVKQGDMVNFRRQP